MVRLLKLKYPNLRLVAEIPDDVVVETESSVALRASYRTDNKRLMVTLEGYSKSTEHPEWFDLYAKIIGIFECDPPSTDDEKRQAHLECYDLLFPFLQVLFAEVTAKAGIPPYHFEKPVITFHDVKVEKKAK